jgi:hypothetical protein
VFQKLLCQFEDLKVLKEAEYNIKPAKAKAVCRDQALQRSGLQLILFNFRTEEKREASRIVTWREDSRILQNTGSSPQSTRLNTCEKQTLDKTHG